MRNKVLTFADKITNTHYRKQRMKDETAKKAMTLKALTKSSAWDLQENDVFRLWTKSEKDSEVKENSNRYIGILKSAFDMELLPDDSKTLKAKYEKNGYKVGNIRIEDGVKQTWAIRKRPILRVTDLSYENIRHITAEKLLEVIERNFGGGWDSLSQSIQDIIESGFDISTTTLPKDRLHKKRSMYEKKMEDGYAVLEVPKGLWVEAIFAKMKPETEKPRFQYQSRDDDEIPEDTFNKPDEDDDDSLEEPDFSSEEMSEDNYSTRFAIDENPDEEAEELSDYDDE